MKCDSCKQDRYTLTNIGPDTWACNGCTSSGSSTEFPHFIETVNYKNYFKNKGNVSKARVEFHKARRRNPEGVVVMTNRFGKMTDRRATPL